MSKWVIETRGFQPILTHHCPAARPGDGLGVLRQDIGGGYVRCERCGEKYLPESEPGKPRLLLRFLPEKETETAFPTVPV